ncbi:uncharacterized protein LOC122956294 [Acropora millepora]|uniref:uncharacterized protein LOC122956294 n=1 Tax=Acropora millepora TaxID=45264 RepID=UPI001CF0E29B|nr:uncharacterized protein LOC122956294 [Acropora millepora]
MSARILAQLMDTIRVALQSQLKIDGVKFWLDSKTALSWIQNKGEWKQFVRHRVNEILKLTAKEDWAYCSTDENPADLGSRGVLASQLKENQLWWCGPSWLTGRPDGWPAMTEAYQTPESQVEEKKSTTVLLTEAERPTGIANVIDVNNHSTLQRLVQVTAWVKRFVNNLRASVTQGSRSTGRLEANELKDAEIEWLKSAQTELKKQHNFKQLEKELGIKTDRNVLRCEGRLLNSDLEIDARKPVILPTKHPFTRLIIEECHQRVLHSGVRATLAELRSRVWVPRGRQTVKRILGECVTCRKLTGKPYSAPPTAALPDFRVREAPPFSRVGVDFAGPLYVKQKSGEMDKAYIALFSCCVTRAVRLELVEDLSTATFRRCLRRFIARNGTPALIVSDNAKTFQATQKALTRLFNHPEVRADLERDKIEWKFNLERAPWWGGFFERMVASAKQCLKKTLGNARLSFDELSTLLTEVESTLNSRPLTYEYNEVDEEVLTPSHLIYGRRIKSLPDEIVEPDDALNHESSSARFKYLSTKLAHFWNRWRKEYLVNLREFHRNKLGRPERIIQVGDVVVVYDEDKKRGEWKLGVVESLVTGKDGIVRGAQVRVITKGKPVHLSRPVQKLYPLEIRSKGEGTRTKSTRNQVVEVPTRNAPRRSAALDSTWKTKLMLDS